MAQGEEIRRIDLLLQKALDEGRRDFIIYPYGDIGRHVNWILNTAYGVAAKYIVDNRLSKYNGKINNSSLFGKINCEDYSLILACTGSKEVHDEIKEGIIPFFDEHHIIDLWGDTKHAGGKWHKRLDGTATDLYVTITEKSSLLGLFAALRMECRWFQITQQTN